MYSTDKLRRCFEAGYPLGLLYEHLLEILKRKRSPPPTELPPVRKTEGAVLGSDVTKEQRPFYTREQIIEESIPPYIKYAGNNLDLVCSTTENTGEETKIGDNKDETIDIMV